MPKDLVDKLIKLLQKDGINSKHQALILLQRYKREKSEI